MKEKTTTEFIINKKWGIVFAFVYLGYMFWLSSLFSSGIGSGACSLLALFMMLVVERREIIEEDIIDKT